MAGAFLAEIQLAVRAVAQKHREEASGKRVKDCQPRARLARRCTMGEALHDGQAPPRQGNRVHGWQRDARWKRRCTAGKRVPGLLLFGWCAEGVHLVYYFHWDAEDTVQLFVCGGVVVAEEPYYCNELVVGYLTEWLVVSLV